MSTAQPYRRPLRVRARRTARSVLVYALVVGVCLIVLVPFLWLVTSSIRPAEELYETPPTWLPRTLTIDAYGTALSTFARPLINSAAYGFAAAGIGLLLGVPAAYSLARYRYRGKRIVVGSLLVSQMLPIVLLLIPLYLVFSQIGLYNTPLGLVIAFTALTLPFSMLLLRSYFATLPRDLEEQAMVDGCTRVGALVRIVVPLSLPVIAATALMSVVLVWNDVLITVFMTNDTRIQTASVALYNLFNLRAGAADRVVLLAGSVLLTLPVVALFAFLQRYMVKGITLGGVK
ncbi:MAG TPA: carbohydrate ABC transporter permease [Candidatus Limnocylindrales bacterium]|nr:carbohydrate ABC transporter permease [Candidatus Limnocylindrales bacterium]